MDDFSDERNGPTGGFIIPALVLSLGGCIIASLCMFAYYAGKELGFW